MLTPNVCLFVFTHYSGTKTVAKNDKDTGGLRWKYEYEFPDTGKIGVVIVDERENVVVTIYNQGEIGGGVLSSENHKLSASISNLAAGYVFVADAKADAAFKRHKIFATPKRFEHEYDDIRPNDFIYLVTKSNKTLTGPYRATSRMEQNLETKGVFAHMPSQVRVDFIDGLPPGKMTHKEALTYVQQGAMIFNEPNSGLGGRLGPGSHAKLYETLVEVSKRNVKNPTAVLAARKRNEEEERRKKVEISREREEEKRKREEREREREKILANKEETERFEIANNSWKNDGHPPLNDMRCSIVQFVNLIAEYPTGVQTLTTATVDFYSSVLDCAPKDNIQSKRAELRRVCKLRTEGAGYNSESEYYSQDMDMLKAFEESKRYGIADSYLASDATGLSKAEKKEGKKKVSFGGGGGAPTGGNASYPSSSPAVSPRRREKEEEEEVSEPDTPENILNHKSRKNALRKSVSPEQQSVWDILSKKFKTITECLVQYIFIIDASRSMGSCDVKCEESDDPFTKSIQKRIYQLGASISRLESARNSILSFIQEKIDHPYFLFQEHYMSIIVMENGKARKALENAPVASPVTFNIVLDVFNIKAKGTGCYGPAFELTSEIAESLMTSRPSSRFGLYFLTDGAPSDSILPGKASVPQRQFSRFSGHIENVARRTGPRLSYSLNLIGNAHRPQAQTSETSVITMMEKLFSSYQCLGSSGSVVANSNSMSASITSFSKLTEKNSVNDVTFGKIPTMEKVVQWERKQINEWGSVDEADDGDWEYYDADQINLYRYDEDNDSFVLDYENCFHWPTATHLGYKKTILSQGSERNVHRIIEVVGEYVTDLDYSKFFMRTKQSDIKLVAKESRNRGEVQNQLETLTYAQDFVRMQFRARELAEEFVECLDFDRELDEVARIEFIEAFAVNINSEKCVLVEDFIEGKYTKWLCNVGRRTKKSKATLEKEKKQQEDDLLRLAHGYNQIGRTGEDATASTLGLGTGNFVIEECDEEDDFSPSEEEGDEEEGKEDIDDDDEEEEEEEENIDDDDSDDEREVIELTDERKLEDVLMTFTHWTYHRTNHQELVCDIQGGYNEEDNVFQLTDPAIHHANTLEHVGRTDHGNKGIKSIMQAHRCNWLCKHLKLPKYFDFEGQRVVFPPEHFGFSSEQLEQVNNTMNSSDRKNAKKNRLKIEKEVKQMCDQLKAKYLEMQKGALRIPPKTDYVIVYDDDHVDEKSNPTLRYVTIAELREAHKDHMDLLLAPKKGESKANKVLASPDQRLRKIDDFMQLTRVKMGPRQMAEYRSALVREVAAKIPHLLDEILLLRRHKQSNKARKVKGSTYVLYEQWLENVNRNDEIAAALKNLKDSNQITFDGDEVEKAYGEGKKVHEEDNDSACSPWVKCVNKSGGENSINWYEHSFTGEKTDIPRIAGDVDVKGFTVKRHITVDQWTKYTLARPGKPTITYWRDEKTNEQVFTEPKPHMLWNKKSKKERNIQERRINSEGPQQKQQLLHELIVKKVNERTGGKSLYLVNRLLESVHRSLIKLNSSSAIKNFEKSWTLHTNSTQSEV